MSQKSFNYESLTDVKTRNEAKKQAEQINRLLRTSGEVIIDIGKRLNAIRESMTSAMFRAWIECEFRWQQSTAANYMQSARVFGDLDCLHKFQPSAIITLARTNVPQSIVDEMIMRARLGEIVTKNAAVLKALKAHPEFAPTRRDAGLVRKPLSKRALEGTTTSGPLTVESFQKSLDLFSANIPKLILQQSDREALANRFFELAVQLRTAPFTRPHDAKLLVATSDA